MTREYFANIFVYGALLLSLDAACLSTRSFAISSATETSYRALDKS